MSSDVVYDAVLGAVSIRQVIQSSFSPGTNPIHGSASGAADPSDIFHGPADPRATLSSADIAGVIAGVSVSTGLSVAAGTITIPWHKRANQATFAGSGAHNTISGADALIIPTGFSASQDEEAAMAELEVVFRSTDGLTNPVTINSAQSLASQAFNAQYAMGPASLNGAAIDELVSWRVNPGIELEVLRHNGGLFPDRIYIIRRRPTIELTFHDMAELNSVASSISVMTAAIVYARKRAGAGFVAAATEEHIKFSFTDGVRQLDTISGSNQESGTVTLRLWGEALTASAASAIT